MFVLWLEGAPGNNVDPNTQKFLEILEQADVIKKGSAWLEIHEQVQIAIWMCLSPSDGAEHRDPMSPALPRDAKDFPAAAAQPLEGKYVIGHPSRVSPPAPPLKLGHVANALIRRAAWPFRQARSGPGGEVVGAPGFEPRPLGDGASARPLRPL